MHWLRRLLHKSRTESQLDSELRFHLERQVADYIAAGMPPDEARRRARLEFGAPEGISRKIAANRAARTSSKLSSKIYASECACSARTPALPPS
jgi:hypothetical protein